MMAARSLALALGLLALAGSPVVLAQAPAWQQLIFDRNQPRAFGVSSIRATAVDAAGDVVVAGVFNGEMEVGNDLLLCAGNHNLFLAKWRPATSAWVWAIADGGYDLTDVTGLALSGSSIFVTGTFTSSPASMLGGSGLPGHGGSDGFVAKYTDTGSTATGAWAEALGGTNADTGAGLAVSGTDVYVTGTFRYNVNIAGTALTSAGQTDVYLAHFSDNGPTATGTWAARSGGFDTDAAGAVAVSNGSVYLAGSFYGRATVAGVPLVSQVSGSGTSTSDIFLARYSTAGAPAWAVRGGGIGPDFVHGMAVSGADIYLAGELGGSGAFGGVALTSIGNYDALLVKYTDAGAAPTVQWAKREGGSGADAARGLAVRGPDLYVTGNFSPGPTTAPTVAGTTLTSAGLTDIFTARYDAGTGAGVWANGKGSQYDDYDFAVAVSSTAVYVGLGTNGSVTPFGPAPALLAADNMAVLGQLDPATGTWQQIAQASDGGSSRARAMTTDAAGNIFITGYFSQQIVFGSTLLTASNNNGYKDIYVAKYSPVANAWVWAVRAGGPQDDDATAIAVVGNAVYVAGTFPSAYGIRVAGVSLTGAGGEDIFIAKYTDNGATVTDNWAVSAGGPADDRVAGLAASASGIYLTGHYTGTIAVGGTVLAAATANPDVYLAKYTDAGVGTWAVRGGGPGDDLAGGVAVNGNLVYITGTCYVGPSTTFAGTTLTGAGLQDVYVAKYIDNGASAANGWAIANGGPYYEQGKTIAVSGANVYIGGQLSSNSTAVIAGVPLTSAGGTDVFVAKYVDQGSSAANGWAVRDGGPNNETATSIAVQGANVYLTGTFFGNNTTIANSPLAWTGNTDVYLARYTDTGTSITPAWANRGGGGGSTSADYADAVAVVGSNVYVSGSIGVPSGAEIVPLPFGIVPPYFDSFVVTNASGSYPLFVARLYDGPAPVITALTPGSSAVGSAISISGTNLSGTTAVVIGGVTVTAGFVVNAAGTQITLTVPAGATSGTATVTGPAGTSNALPFTLVLATATQSFSHVVTLAPNPATARVAVLVPGVAGATQLTATVLNALGQTVLTRTATLPAAGASLQLDVAGLARGVYTVRLAAGSAVAAKRLVLE